MVLFFLYEFNLFHPKTKKVSCVHLTGIEISSEYRGHSNKKRASEALINVVHTSNFTTLALIAFLLFVKFNPSTLNKHSIFRGFMK